MRKVLLWAAAVTFGFATFLASCATQPQADEHKAPAPASQKQGAKHQSMALSGIALRAVTRSKLSSSAAPTA